VLAPTDYSTPAHGAVRVAAAWFPTAQLHVVLSASCDVLLLR
jgi:hypothetical protein